MVNLLHVNRPMRNLLYVMMYLSMVNLAVAASNPVMDRPTLDASSLVLDGPSNLMVLTDVRISTQNGYVIKAGEARTTDSNNFNNSTWTFAHKVEIATPNGSSTADTATVSFVDNQISTLHVTGSPATFEQHAADKVVAQGHADNIDYDLKQHTVRLTNNAWVSYGQNECRAVALVYNIILQRVSANRADQQGERIICTIAPAAGTENKPDSP